MLRVEPLLRLVGLVGADRGRRAVPLGELEFTIPSDVFATIAGSAVFGVAERSTTVYLPVAETLRPRAGTKGCP